MDSNGIEHSNGCHRDPGMPGEASSKSIVGKFIPNVVVVGSRGCSLLKLFMSGLFCLILGLIVHSSAFSCWNRGILHYKEYSTSVF